MKNRRVLIVGAGEAGSEAQEIIDKSPDAHVVGFIDDKRTGKKVREILGALADIKAVIEQYQITEIVVAIPSAPGELIRRLVTDIADSSVTLRVIPRLSEIVLGHVKGEYIRPIEPEDLVGRAVVQQDLTRITRSFRNRNVLITGGAGSIGSEIVRQLIFLQPHTILIYDWNENGLFYLNEHLKKLGNLCEYRFVVGNIHDQSKITSLLTKHDVHDIIHAAAYKHVPLMEEFPEEAVHSNIFGTLSVLAASREALVQRFLFISTDKAVRPTSVMGATKLIAESLVLGGSTRGTKTSAVRFVNVLGSEGSMVPLFEQQIREGGPVTITHRDMVRYVMTPQEAAQLTLTAMAIMEGGERFMLEMGEPVRVLELAKLMIRLHGLNPDKDVPIVCTGIRPGEKLSEDLTTAHAYQKTSADGVWVAQEPILPTKALNKLLRTLRADRQDAESIRKHLFEAIAG